MMYLTFALMLIYSGILMMPNGHIVINHADGSSSEHLAFTLSIVWFPILIFILGSAMGIGKAAVYKHIPEYFPENVGSVGGHVGILGGLGGFFLPPLFAHTKDWSGFPHPTFFVISILTAICAVWMHVTIVRMMAQDTQELAGSIERPMKQKADSQMAKQLETDGDWLKEWYPEDDEKWDKRLAWHTLLITTFTLTMAFAVWFLPSAIIPKLRPLGYDFTPSQLYWMAAMPGLSGGALRVLWIVLPPKIGTRKLVSLTTLPLLLPLLGWALK